MDRTFEVSGGYLLLIRNLKEEAQAFFKKIYPGIEYLPESDSFRYRDWEFDYFVSGVNYMDLTNPKHLFMLRDKKPNPFGSYDLLFQYDDKEERWKEFIQKKKEDAEYINKLKYGWTRYLCWIGIHKYKRESPHIWSCVRCYKKTHCDI